MMTLQQALALLPGARLVGDGAVAITRVHSDTRSLQPGDLFVALKGDTFDANTLLASDQAFSYIGAAAFSSAAGQLRFAGNILSGDVDGNGTGDFEIQLLGVASLTAGDFVL